jgi:ABC-type transport system substrate-binding protein
MAQDGPWRAGDGIRISGSVSGPASLDPALARDLDVNYMLQHVFRGLMTLDADLVPVPCLAEQVDVLEGGTLYRFVMRTGASFHDGRVVSAQDVAASLSRALNPDIAGGLAGALAAVTYVGDIAGAEEVLAGTTGTLSGVTVVNEQTVEIRLRQPSPTFLMRLASVQASIVDVAQVEQDPDWWRAPNGSGPYAVESWNEGESIAMRAADTWWAGKPAVDSVTFWLGASAVEPLNLYQAGKVDLVGDVNPEQVALVRDPASGISYGDLQETMLFATSYIALGNQTAPLDDVHVRRAIQRCYPAADFARGGFGDTVSVATGLVPPGMLGVNWDADMPEVDIESARAELAASRYGSANDVPPISIYGADTGPIDSLRAVVNDALGLDVQAVEVPFPEFIAGLGERRFPAYAIYWGADYPDPESMIGMLFGSTSADNYTGYSNAELDDLLDQARMQEGDERVATLQRANQLLVDDAAVIALYHPHGYSLSRAGMLGVQATPMGIQGLETVYEAD